jgi:asparagine synthase (glutamine-hydrolysing)
VAAAQAICDGAFGDYVIVLAQDRGEPAVLRGPSGMIDAFAWRREDLTLVSDEIPEGLAGPIGLSLDWDAVGAVLRQSVRAAAGPPLRGVTALDPGMCFHGPQLSCAIRVWSPSKVVRRGQVRPPVEALRAAVDLAIGVGLEGAERVLCEISGGLDSAIIAGSLAAAGRPADSGINFWREQREADERVYAEAAAALAKTPLTTVRRDLLNLDASAFDFSARSVRPNLNSVDPDYDRLLVEAVRSERADVLFTGHGGDVVFYQLGAAEIAADLLSGQPCEGSRAARLVDIARRTRRSVWSLAWEALRRRPGVNSPSQQIDEADGIVRARASGPVHPWTADTRGVSRAKRVQIAGLVTSLGVTTPTARGDAVRLAHPLLAQPVVELCLQAPIPLLSSGEGERTFARRAFADRLPSIIANRRSKGDVTAFFGRSMALSASFLREHLLDGRLVAQGLLNRASLEAALAPEALIWRDTYGVLLVAATLEAWVRHWEGRIAGSSTVDLEGAPIASSKKASARA